MANWDHPMWGAIIQVDDFTVNVCCEKHNFSKFIWNNQSLNFFANHKQWTSGKLIGVLPQKKLKSFFQIHKPKIYASSLTNAAIELIHYVCEKNGSNYSPRIFALKPWKGCDFELKTSRVVAKSGLPILSQTLPCVQEFARVVPQIGQLGLVCNHSLGLEKHQPIGVFNGEILSKKAYYKDASREIIKSERDGAPCNRTAYALCVGSDHVLDGFRARSYVSAANHSCGESANTRVEYWNVHGFSFLVLVANKKIPFNAPLVYDYGKKYLLSNNQICYGVFCRQNCYFEAMCSWLNDGGVIFYTKNNKTVIIPKPPQQIQEIKLGKTHCHVAISTSSLFAHKCISLFFAHTANHYSWTF